MEFFFRAGTPTASVYFSCFFFKATLKETLIQCEMFRESNVLLDYSSSDSDDDNDDDDSDDDISDSDNTVPTLITHFSRTIQNRYLERGKYRKLKLRI
jgi:hypothetical protein